MVCTPWPPVTRSPAPPLAPRIRLDSTGNTENGARADLVAPAVNVGDIGVAGDTRVNVISDQYLHFANRYPYSGMRTLDDGTSGGPAAACAPRWAVW
jgi:hypothetical protein